MFYLAIAIGSVTPRDLLRENLVKLPVLGVELPLVGFFLIAPILFVISHAYVLVHFVLLAAKANRYHQELRAQVADPALREKFRSRMPSNIFVQLVAGPRDMRRGAFGWILQIEA